MSTKRLLLDTCATLWITNGQPLAEPAREALADALSEGDAVFVSPITAWEVGLLASKGRITLPDPPVKWFRRLLQAPGLSLAAMDPAILIGSSSLPGFPLRDPADRIIVTTARENGFHLITRDRVLLAYAGQGYCRALAC